jgi:hypothetical protein
MSVEDVVLLLLLVTTTQKLDVIDNANTYL